MASGISMRISFLTLALMLTLLSSAKGNLNHSSEVVSSRDVFKSEDQLPVSVAVNSNIGRPGVVLFNMESVSTIKLRYSINCTSREIVYSIFATTSAKHVAAITGSPVFNISCANANLINSQLDEKEPARDSVRNEDIQEYVSFTGVPFVMDTVEGEVNLTLKADMIGRSFLIFIAQKVSGFEHTNTNITNAANQQLNFSSLNGIPSPYKTHNTAGYISDSHNVSIVTEAGQESQDLNQPHLPSNVVGKAMIIVMQLPRLTDKIFRIVLYIVIILATIGMGVKVEFLVIKNELKKPTGPIIGLCCQYICMPVISYVVAITVPQESPAVSLGIFACGIVPGGGASNMFSYLLGADLSLSVTMTTLSSIVGLGMLPLWLFTLGDTFKDDTVEMHVPYEKILEALAIAILPLFLGMFIKYKVPKVAAMISKVLKPVLLVIIAFSLSFGIYTNFYIFKMIRPMTIFAGCLLPYVGYLAGGFVSFLCFRSWTHIKTIAIETGIQNTAIAFLILFLSLPPPDNQLASVAPASSVIMTPLPLFVAVLFYTIYNRRTKKHKFQETKSKNKDLEKGNTQNEKSLVDVDVSIQQNETALIILFWHKITGKKQTRNMSDGISSIKELHMMLPQNESTDKK